MTEIAAPEAPEALAAEQPMSAGRGALAGALGAAAALAVIEVVSVLDATGTSATEAVGNRFIDAFGASLKDLAVQLFGDGHKAALQLGTAIVAIAIGAALGRRAWARPGAVVAGFAGFGLVGIAAAAGDPLASVGVASMAVGLAAVVGIAVTLGLARWWSGTSSPSPSPSPSSAGGPSPVARRTVLLNAGVLAALLVAGTAAARSARSSLRTAATTVRVALPRPSRRVAVPTGTLEAGADAVEGISPYVTPTDDFYRIDTALRVPAVDVDGWELKIGGMVDRELTFTFDDLMARDLIEVPITMLCVSNSVGGTLVGTARWLGVPLAELLAEAGVQEGAEQVMGESVDGFTAGFPVEVALDGRDALLAVAMNGEPLPAEHGFPARLVVPGIYGYVSATKWIREIRLTTWDEQGYWIPRGWSRLGPIKLSARIDVPRSGADLAVGPQVAAGVAWAPTIGIGSVEVRADEGPWIEAELGPVASVDTWVQWRATWEATGGDHVLTVRATDAEGRVQTAEIARPDPDGATGHHSIQVRASD